MPGSQPMSGYQSEFLTYVKRTGTLPGSPVARTTSRYGRPIGTTSSDRRTGFVEFAPAARKFPDNSPLNTDSPRKAVASPGAKTNNEERSKGQSVTDGASSQVSIVSSSGEASKSALPPPAPPPESLTTSATVETYTEGKLGYVGAGFSSAVFYSRKDPSCSKMKDRDVDGDARSTTSDTASLRGGTEVGGDTERRSRRRSSPAASLNGDDIMKVVRSKSGSPAANGTPTLSLMLRSGPTCIQDDPRHVDKFENSHSVGSRTPDELQRPGSTRLGSSVKSDNEDSLEASDKIFCNPRIPRGDSILTSRPKRHIIPKNMESGLSWREENDLKKALYASLQETKRDEGAENGIVPDHVKVLSGGDKRRSLGAKYWLNLVVDDSSQESNRSGVSSETSSESKGSLLKVRAQRKFAVGSRPGSPGTTPLKSKPSPRKFFTTKKAKTEDFLTFLCLRGSNMLPPHLDFSKMDDSEDCFQPSCPNTPRGSRPSTPAISGLSMRDLTPRGGRGVPGSRSTTPDRDLSLDDNELGVKPLLNDASSPVSSPSKKIATKPVASPPKTQLGKRKSLVKLPEEPTSDDKRPRAGQDKDKCEVSPRRREKERNKKRRKARLEDGKVRKKKKKRKEEAKMLRRKLVLRACNTAVKASRRKLKLAAQKVQRSLRGETSSTSTDKQPEKLESITSILECLSTAKRGVGRPRKVDAPVPPGNVVDIKGRPCEKDKGKTENNKKLGEPAAVDQPLTRTRSPETRSSTRNSSRSVSPYKSPPGKTPLRDADKVNSGNASGSSSGRLSSRRDRRTALKLRRKDKLKKALLRKKVTRSESRLQEAQKEESEQPNPPTEEETPIAESTQQEPMYRTRSLPLLPPVTNNSPQQESAEQNKPNTALRRAISAITKSVKKTASTIPTMPPSASLPEKKGRGRPPGTGKKQLAATTPSNISILKMSFRAPFPSPTDPGRVVEVPTYHPSSEQFQDPIAYVQSIRADAEPFGMCRIVPPDGWKPECKFPDDLKFMTRMQYIHRMWTRWGPNALALESIRRHLQSQGIKLEQAPMVGGVELDLPALSETLQQLGGMQSVIDKNKWPKVIESLRIPKLAPERCSKLYDSYCKFLLSYDTLPVEEKQRLEQQVLVERDKGQLTANDECVSKGRIRHLSDFFRHSRNIESVWFKKEPTVQEVEELYWRLLEGAEHHVAVQVAEVDTKVCGSGFPTRKDSPYSRHGWNLNILQHNSGSVLRCLGPVSGVTVPLLHVGMTFSTKCWSANDHLLPQVVYKHTGADTIWYCLPTSEESKFHSVCRTLIPDQADDDPVWLLDDTAMISPQRLTEHGVSLGRTTLCPGQFLFVFPEAFTSAISCGYNLSESLHFATPDWIPLGAKAAQMLHDSGVPEQFSMDRLLFKLARYEKTPMDTLEHVLPQLELVVERETRERQELEEAGLHATERMCLYDDDVMTSSKRRHKYENPEPGDNVCDVSKRICYLSMVLNEAEDTVYSLEHALSHIQKKRNLKVCKLLYRYTIDEINSILDIVRARLEGQEPGLATVGPPAKKKAAK